MDQKRKEVKLRDTNQNTRREEVDDSLGQRFRNLVPGHPRNPEYRRNILIRNCSNETIVGAIKEAQKKQRKENLNLFKPSFCEELRSSSVFPTDDQLFTSPNKFNYTEYVMACNGAPTTYLKPKTENGNVNTELDEDLRKKVETLQIGDRKDATQSSSETEAAESKTYEDWKDELPVHLKSLKFMLEVLNDRHRSPESFASRTLTEIPPPVFKSELKDLEVVNDTWTDQAFPFPGDRIYPPGNPNEVAFAKRPIRIPVTSARGGRRPRVDAKSIPRRRTKSAEPDLSSYRNETPFGTRFHKHRNSDSAYWFRKRRSVEHAGGVYVVEEISEEDEEEAEAELKRIGSADGSPDSLSLELIAPLESNPLKPVHRLRRDLWNISPISESEDTEAEMNAVGNVEVEENVTISSTNATFGDSMSMTVNSRLNCSSPILSHSPSLGKTPVRSENGSDADTPNTPTSSKGRKQRRDIARELADISDKEEEHTTSEDEETESFEIDLGIGTSNCSDSLELLNVSFNKDKSSSSLNTMEVEDNENRADKQGNEASAGTTVNISETLKANDKQKTTVWETLSANIQAHLDDGNSAGFVEGPVDNPLHNQKQAKANEHPSPK